MILNSRLNANSLFLGDIKNSIYADSLVWLETEKIEIECLYNFLLEHFINLTSNIYFFTTVVLKYPLDWRIKRFGLWNTYAMKFGLTTDYSVEHFSEKSRYAVISGCCYTQCTKEIIELFIKNSFRSWILVSEKKYEFAMFSEMLLNQDNDKTLPYEFIINNFCHENDRIAIMLDRSGEASFNIFYECKNDN